jgi:nucleotide-binding universal stress UspA family protein
VSAIQDVPQHITVGIDGSIESHAALLWAIDHAHPGDTVHLVYAWQPAVAGFAASDDDTTALRSIGREVARARRLIHDQRIAISGEVVHGTPRDCLLAISTDLVVVGARHHRSVVDMFLGSVSRYLVRYSPVPIVVVPGPQSRAHHHRASSQVDGSA